MRSAVVIFKMRSGVGARSVCSAPKANKDCEASLERGESAPLRRLTRIAKRCGSAERLLRPEG